MTVDHALRPGSADEAETVAHLCAGLGIRHRTVIWTGDKPARGVAAAARLARYRLLAEAASDMGATIVFTGHTADDQAETVLMRSQRGSGRGLAAMAPATAFDSRIWLLRPLLGTRRRSLRDWLTAEHHGWSDDPTNVDLRHERPRLRVAFAADPQAFRGALDVAGKEGEARRALGVRAGALIRSFSAHVADGLYRLDAELLDSPDRDAMVYAMRLLLATVGGRSDLPPLAATTRLVAELAISPVRRVLSRTLVDRRRDAIWLLRERRAMPPPTEASAETFWDGRFRLATVSGPAATSPACEPAADTPAALLRQARAVEPPAINGYVFLPIVAPFALFLPSHDWPVAQALAALRGASLPGPPPLHEHNAMEA